MTMQEINADEPTPELWAWLEDHGLDPHDIKKRPVLMDEEGRIHLERFRFKNGRIHVTGDGDVVTELIVVTPKRPMPCPLRDEETVTFSGPDRGAQAVQWLLSDDDD